MLLLAGSKEFIRQGEGNSVHVTQQPPIIVSFLFFSHCSLFDLILSFSEMFPTIMIWFSGGIRWWQQDGGGGKGLYHRQSSSSSSWDSTDIRINDYTLFIHSTVACFWNACLNFIYCWIISVVGLPAHISVMVLYAVLGVNTLYNCLWSFYSMAFNFASWDTVLNKTSQWKK